jgi:hypothetical protein
LISLVLHGKAAVTEDPLTAALLDALRYSNKAAVVGRLLLDEATPFVPGNALPTFDHCEVQAWPPLEGREPDARLVLSRDGEVVCHLLVEAKLWAGKTGEGPIDSTDCWGDQLADYLALEENAAGGMPVALLYLTHHAYLPRADLKASASELERLGKRHLAGALYWRSWQDVERALAALEVREPWLQDLAQVLKRAGLFRFTWFDVTGALSLGPAPEFYSGHQVAGYPDAAEAKQLGPLGPDDWGYRSFLKGRKRG